VLESCSSPHKTRQVFESALKKYFGVLGLRFSVRNVIRGVGFWPFWLSLPGPGPNPLNGSIFLKFLLETRLESKSLELLIDFLRFYVQKVWPKNNKIINLLIT